MKESINNFFKGIIAGIGNIVPGVSGSALLIILGLYEKCIDSISNLFKNFKENMMFLFPIGLGVLVGLFSFSNVIEYCLTNYEVITSFIFLGLLTGTIPQLFKESKSKGFKKSYLIPFFISLIIGIILLVFKANNLFTIDINFMSLILIGLIVAFATVVPGISNTVLLTMLGLYQTFLNAINTINLNLLLPIIMGVVIGTFILAKLLNNLFKNYYGYTYFAILGFVISTIPGLIPSSVAFNKDLVFGIILAIISFFITYLIPRIKIKNH